MNAWVVCDSAYGIAEQVARAITSPVKERGTVRLVPENKLALT